MLNQKEANVIYFHTQHQEYVQATFQALTDALLPEANQPGYVPHYARDMGVHEYIIYGLNHYISVQQQLHHQIIPLAYTTAVMLDVAAAQLVNSRQAQAFLQSVFPGGRMFSHLSRKDRVRTTQIFMTKNQA